MKRTIAGVLLVFPTLSLLGYWLFWKAIEAVGMAVENLGDIEWGDDEDYDYYYGKFDGRD